MDKATKLVPCAYARCGERRVHFERPYEPRGTQMIKVPADFASDAFCSITCAVLAGKISLRQKNSHEQLLEAMEKKEDRPMTPG